MAADLPIDIKEEDDDDDEEAMEADDDVEIKQEPTAEDEMDYKEAVDEGQHQAETFGFDENEVDFGDDDEQDVEMDQAEQEESEEEDELQDEDPRAGEEEEKKQRTHAEEMAAYPKWALPLETGSKPMPTEELLNVDPDEGAARIFDNVVVNYLIRNFSDYYKNRVHEDPEKYFHDIVSNKYGRIDLDGICQYCPGPGPELEPPTTGQLRAWWDMKVKEDKYEKGLYHWAVREWEQKCL